MAVIQHEKQKTKIKKNQKTKTKNWQWKLSSPFFTTGALTQAVKGRVSKIRNRYLERFHIGICMETGVLHNAEI